MMTSYRRSRTTPRCAAGASSNATWAGRNHAARAARLPRAERTRERAPPAPAIVEIRHADVFRGSAHVLAQHRPGRSAPANTPRSPERTASARARSRWSWPERSRPFYGGEVLRFDAEADPSTSGRSRPRSRTSPRNGRSRSGHQPHGPAAVRASPERRPSSTNLTLRSASVRHTLIDELGLTPLRGRPFMQLSFGERRSVLIARSLWQAARAVYPRRGLERPSRRKLPHPARGTDCATRRRRNDAPVDRAPRGRFAGAGRAALRARRRALASDALKATAR